MTTLTMPHNLNAERAIIGSCLLDREAIVVVAPRLAPENFYLQRYGIIYEAICACYDARIPPDVTTVAEALRRSGQLEDIGGISYLGELAAEVPTSVHAEYYASIVADLAVRRRLIEAGARIQAYGHDEREDLNDALTRADHELRQASAEQRLGGFATIGMIAQEAIGDEGETGPVWATGLRDLDAQLGGGLEASRLYLIAARPGMGKSALGATQLPLNMARAGARVGIFSLEMRRSEIMQRIVASASGLQRRRGDAESLPSWLDAQSRVADLPILIDDTPGLTIDEVRRLAMRAHATAPLDVLVIDYLQLVSGSRTRQNDANRVQEVSEISRKTKLLARELDIPVIALSQLSRAVESRAGKVPQLSDLRESGALEQDADAVIFIHREDNRPGEADLIVAKQRNGPLGTVTVQYTPALHRFRDLVQVRAVEGYSRAAD